MVQGKGALIFNQVKIELMTSPVSRESTEQNAFCLAQLFQKLTGFGIFEYLFISHFGPS